MVVVVASRHDREAAVLVERWASAGAALSTCEDLSVPGWRFEMGDPGAGAAVAGGSVVPVSTITGVLTRRPRVFAAELGRFAEADREYVAAEMSAFLLGWLASLPCPTLNRPTPGCLCGPGWGPERWTRAAAALGLRVRPVRTSVPECEGPPPAPPTTAVTVVDGRCFGASGVVAGYAARLAAASGARLLSVRFDLDGAFVDASPLAALAAGPVVDAVLEALTP